MKMKIKFNRDGVVREGIILSGPSLTGAYFVKFDEDNKSKETLIFSSEVMSILNMESDE